MNELLYNIEIIYNRKNHISNLINIINPKKSLISRFFADKTLLKKIGAGWNVSVYANSSEPMYIAKVYENSNLKYLADTEMNMLLHIQNKINLDEFKYIKIPKLLEYGTTDMGIVHIFERVYNINDTDINNPSDMLHVYITNNPTTPVPEKIAGRGNIVTLDEIEKYINEDLLQEYMYELGRIFGLLNFKALVISDDIEIVFGKDSINDNHFKFYILDFDRVKDFYVSDAKYIDILGRKDYFIFPTLNDIYKNKFYDGYLYEAKLNNMLSIAEHELQKIGYKTIQKLNFIAYNGQYIVTKPNWVYDVLIHDGIKDIATVGFSTGNTNGAIFWKSIPWDEKKVYLDNEDIILNKARSYALSQGVPI